MPRSKFYARKLKFLLIFAWWGEWKLFKAEWSGTYADMLASRASFKQFEREGLERLLRALDDEPE